MRKNAKEQTAITRLNQTPTFSFIIKHARCIEKLKDRNSLLKLWALDLLLDKRVAISNQSRKRVSLRGVEMPACCYLCWGSALVIRVAAASRQWREGVPARCLYPRLVFAHSRGQRRTRSTSTREEGWESPQEVTKKAVTELDFVTGFRHNCLIKVRLSLHWFHIYYWWYWLIR